MTTNRGSDSTLAVSDQDLAGIIMLMRSHIEIRNRSIMRNVHRDCFLGSDAVDFLVTHGFADSRQKAEEIGRRMMVKKLIRHVSDGNRFRDASHLYYRFIDDDDDSALLAATNGGNGNGLYLGQGGCKHSSKNWPPLFHSRTMHPLRRFNY